MEANEKGEDIYLRPMEEVMIKQEYDPLEDWTDVCEQPYQEQNECQSESVYEMYIKEEPRESIEDENKSLLNARHEDHVFMVDNDEQRSPKVKQEDDLYSMTSSGKQLFRGQCKTEIDAHAKEGVVDMTRDQVWRLPGPTQQLANHLLTTENDDSSKLLSSKIDITVNSVRKKSLFERRYQCMICKELFKHSSILKKHILIHDSEMPFGCTMCEKKFKTSYGLRRHERGHTGEKKHQCEFCGRKFSQIYTLTRHIRTHTGERPFQCQFCDKGFANNSNYKDHLRLHTGEKPFQCRYCKTKFSMRVYVKKHEPICKERTDDLDEKTVKLFYCKMCDKGYKSAFILKQHERTHTGERPFQCSVCQKRFNTQCYLKQHERQHTGEKPFECKYCGRTFSMSLYLYKHVKVCKKKITNQEDQIISDDSS